MNDDANAGATHPAPGSAGPEMLESAAALGRDALEKTMRMTGTSAILPP